MAEQETSVRVEDNDGVCDNVIELRPEWRLPDDADVAYAAFPTTFEAEVATHDAQLPGSS